MSDAPHAVGPDLIPSPLYALLLAVRAKSTLAWSVEHVREGGPQAALDRAWSLEPCPLVLTSAVQTAAPRQVVNPAYAKWLGARGRGRCCCPRKLKPRVAVPPWDCDTCVRSIRRSCTAPAWEALTQGR